MFSSNYTSGVMSPGLAGALARAFGNDDNSGSKPTQMIAIKEESNGRKQVRMHLLARWCVSIIYRME